MKQIVERSFLVRKIQCYEVDLPAGADDMKFGELDQFICDTGALVSETDEPLDEWDLEHHFRDSAADEKGNP